MRHVYDKIDLQLTIIKPVTNKTAYNI